MKRLFWDIETSPNIGFFWKSGFKQNISFDSIIHERKIICIAYKWEGEKKVHVLKWDENQDDKEMLLRFIEVANESDDMVAHFGDSFDLKWFRTRCLYHGIQTFPFYRTTDTCKLARQYFYFNSNKLDYIAQFLGLGKKKSHPYSLWVDVALHRDKKALKDMLAYCKNDVVMLENVYNELIKHCKPNVHVGVLHGNEKWSCAFCGGTNVSKSKERVTAMGAKRYQMQCSGCGKYYTISNAVYNKYLDRE